MNRSRRSFDSFIVVGFVMYVLANIAFWGGALYVAVHFVNKYW